MERMDHNNLVGKKVFLKLMEEVVDDFKDWDIGHKELVVFISGIEQNGIWLRHPNFKITFKIDKSGNKISESERKSEEIEADIFIPWGYIKGIVCPHDDRLKYDNEPEKKMGFTVSKKREI